MKFSGTPLYLLRPFASRDPSPAEVVRRFYAAQVWRSSSLLQRGALLGRVLSWLCALPVSLMHYTRRNGAAVKRRVGRGIRRQVRDQIRVALRYGLSPREYYSFELFHPGRRADEASYLSRHETDGKILRLLEGAKGRAGASSLMTDKERFTATCRDAGLAVAPILMVATKDGLRPPRGGDIVEIASLPRVDLFVKPARSSIASIHGDAAFGAARWDYVGDGDFRSADGKRISAEQLLEHLREVGEGFECLIQPRLRNHPAIADLSNGALSTVTIQTFLNERDLPEIVGAVLHFAVGANTLADNVSLGGLVAAIDLESGRLGQATDSGKGVSLGWIDVHPDTGAQITGRQLPLWREAVELACRAHEHFADSLVIGWDIALSEHGPMLIEGDPRGFVTMKQRAYRRPFGSMRYGELLAHHVQRATALSV